VEVMNRLGHAIGLSLQVSSLALRAGWLMTSGCVGAQVAVVAVVRVQPFFVFEGLRNRGYRFRGTFDSR